MLAGAPALSFDRNNPPPLFGQFIQDAIATPHGEFECALRHADGRQAGTNKFDVNVAVGGRDFGRFLDKLARHPQLPDSLTLFGEAIRQQKKPQSTCGLPQVSNSSALTASAQRAA